MKPNFDQDPSYLKLVQLLKKASTLFSKAQQQQQRLQTLDRLWRLGKQIKKTHQELPHGKKEALYIALAKDTQINRTDLAYLSRFYGCFPQGLPKFKNGEALTWTHYRSILTLKDKKERRFYLQYAAQEGLSTRHLEIAVKGGLYLSETTASSDHPHGVLAPRLNVAYTYKTQILQVKDGDTLRLMSDMGFFARQEYTGRLRGINTSELNGPNHELALKAKAHVEKVLAPCGFVMATTSKPDSFGRNLVEIRYHPLWEDPNKIYELGFFLNQELLDLGLARLAPF